MSLVNTYIATTQGETTDTFTALFRPQAQFFNRGFSGFIQIGESYNAGGGVYEAQLVHRSATTSNIATMETDADVIYSPIVDVGGNNIRLFRIRSVWVTPSDTTMYLVARDNPDTILIYNFLNLADASDFTPHDTIAITSGYEIYCIVDGGNYLYTVEKQGSAYFLCQRDKNDGTLENSYALGATAGGFSLHYFQGNVYLLYNADWDAVCTTGDAQLITMLFAQWSPSLSLLRSQTIIHEADNGTPRDATGWWDGLFEEDMWLETDTPTDLSHETSRMAFTTPFFYDDVITVPMGMRLYQYTPNLTAIVQSGSTNWASGAYFAMPAMNNASHVGNVAAIAGAYCRSTDELIVICKVDAPSTDNNDRQAWAASIDASLPDAAGTSVYKQSITQGATDAVMAGPIFTNAEIE